MASDELGNLKVLLSAETAKYIADVKHARGESVATGDALNKLGGIARGALTAGLAVGAVGIAALGKGIAYSIGEAMEAQEVQAQLGAVIASTGGIAGVSAEEATGYADALTQVTRYSDEAILSAENILLTFTKIKDDVFPEATEIVLDMSAALGQDLQSSAIQVGKALQDPILGVTALRRVGVNFSEDQQDVIRSLVETGQAAEAQRLIMAELRTEFGGSAKAAGATFAGQLDILKNSFSNVAEEVGTALIPKLTGLVQEVGPQLVDMFADLSESAIPKAVEALADFVVLMVDGVEAGLLLLEWNENINNAFENHEKTVIATAETYEDYTEEIERAADVAGKYAMTQEELGDVVYWLGEQSTWAKNAVILKTEAEFEAYRMALLMEDAELKLAIARSGLTVATETQANALDEELIPALEATAEETALLEEGLARIEFQLDDPLGKAYDDFTEKNVELTGKVAELKAGIAELEEKTYLTTAQKQQLADMRTELGETETALDDLAIAHEEATYKILFGMLQQELALDGWTQEEITLLGKAGVAWGLLSENAGQAFDDFGTAMEIWRESGNYDLTIGAIEYIGATIGGIEGTHDINFQINTLGSWPDPTDPSNKTYDDEPYDFGASGLDMIVPPGFPNDSYTIAVSTGEHVSVKTRGQQAEQGGAQIINRHVYINQLILPDVRDGPSLIAQLEAYNTMP